MIIARLICLVPVQCCGKARPYQRGIYSNADVSYLFLGTDKGTTAMPRRQLPLMIVLPRGVGCVSDIEAGRLTLNGELCFIQDL